MAFKTLKKPEDCTVSADNKRVIEFDVKRTSKDVETCIRLKNILYNIVELFENTTGYLQGMNFMVHYLMTYYSSDLEIIQFFIYLNECHLAVTFLPNLRVSTLV